MILAVVLKTGCHSSASSRKFTRMRRYNQTINFSTFASYCGKVQREGGCGKIPLFSANYSKAETRLRARFGRDLLVKVHVRDVLKIIISAHHTKEEISFSSLYDKIESNLWTLKNLGFTMNTFSLVQSCFPEQILRAWHRRVNATQGVDARDKMDSLMEF